MDCLDLNGQLCCTCIIAFMHSELSANFRFPAATQILQFESSIDDKPFTCGQAAEGGAGQEFEKWDTPLSKQKRSKRKSGPAVEIFFLPVIPTADGSPTVQRSTTQHAAAYPRIA